MSNQKTVEERINVLEAEFENVKKLKGVPGARGPAGEISAAVRNAEAAVSNAENRVQVRADAAYAQFATEVKALREEVAALRKFLDERIRNEVDGHTVQVLRDYHLLDENHAPTHWKK